MKKKKKDQKRDYEVGYGKPPKHTRWPKGQSGNLGGRPVKSHLPSLWKQLDPLNATILEQAARLLDVRTPEGKKTISRLEAALEKLYKMGMQGNRLSLVTFIDFVQNAQDKQKELTQEIFRAAILHHQTYAEPFETAEREGKPVPKILPHPKDVIIDLSDDDYPVRIVGPVTWARQAQVEEWERQRDEADWALKQLQMRDDIDQEELDFLIPKIKANRAKFNDALPPRLQKPPP